jgi:hypothetical protein
MTSMTNFTDDMKVAVTQPEATAWIGTVIGEDHLDCKWVHQSCRVRVQRSMSWIESVLPEHLTEVA